MWAVAVSLVLFLFFMILQATANAINAVFCYRKHTREQDEFEQDFLTVTNDEYEWW